MSILQLDWNRTPSSGGARTSRQPGHYRVSTVVRQVISCELCEGPKVKISVSQGASQGASQGRRFLARTFDLARPGVAPPLTPSNLVQFSCFILSIVGGRWKLRAVGRLKTMPLVLIRLSLSWLVNAHAFTWLNSTSILKCLCAYGPTESYHQHFKHVV